MNSKKVFCITTCETFDSYNEAAKKYKVHATNISKCCKGERNYTGKLQNGVLLQWKYSEEDDDESKAV